MPRVVDAFVHDLAYQWGGGERVFASLAEMEPEARAIFVAGRSSVVKSHMPDRQFRIVAPAGSIRQARAIVPALATVLPRLRPIEGRVAFSSYALAHWLPTAERRFIYCHSPMRQIWHGRHFYTPGRGFQSRSLEALSPWLRDVDRRARQTDDVVVVPTTRIADIVQKTYGTAPIAVIPPAVDAAFLTDPLGADRPFFVWSGRVVEPVKRLGWLMEAFSQLPRERLLVIGDGRSRRRIETHAPPNVNFLGWLAPELVRDVLSRAKAFLLPSMEDFGLAAAEAMAMGTPLVVTREAGISEWVVHGQTGLVAHPSKDAFMAQLAEAVEFEFAGGEEIRRHALRFSAEAFHKRIRDVLREELGWID